MDYFGIKEVFYLSRRALPSAVRITVVGGADIGHRCRPAWLPTRLTEQDALYDLLQSPESGLQHADINTTLMNLCHAVNMSKA